MDKKKKDIFSNLESSSDGFKVPTGYFENLETELFKKAMSSDSNKRSKHLKKLRVIRTNEVKPIKKTTGFKVPIGYFEEVDARFDKSIIIKKEVRKIHSLRLISMSIAASILLFIGIKFLNLNTNSSSQIVLQNDEIASWMDEDLVSFDTYEIAEAFGDLELEQTLYTDEAVNDYLIFMDIESLIIEN